MPEPVIVVITSKICLGKCLEMSLADNKVGQLWQSFMPLARQISNRTNTEVLSVQVHPADYFEAFDPTKTFEKWAVVELTAVPSTIPEGMDILVIPAGLYAVFHYKGLSSDSSIFRYIFNDYLPASIYELDQRPHFEVLGDKYKNMDPNSEEDIYIPIRIKQQ